MIIQPETTSREVYDYDFSFSGGQFLGLTIDPHFGDYIDLDNPNFIKVYMGQRPSVNPSGDPVPSEEVTLLTHNMCFMAKRTRMTMSKTPEQEAEWQKTLMEMSKSVM